MQTKLRMLAMLAVTFVAGLLWTSALAAAPAPKDSKLVKAVHKAMGGRPKYVGVASWYGKQNQGRKMANGMPFDRRKMTAAAWYIPLGTLVRVVNLQNGNGVDVTVTDRGPHPRLRRAIDLSEAAAIQLDYVNKGLVSVFILPLPKAEYESARITAELIGPEIGPEDLNTDTPVQFDAKELHPAPAEATILAANLN